MYVNKEGLREIRDVLFKRPTVGRLVTTAWIGSLYMTIRQATVGFRALDELIHPEYRDQKIDKPVFVFANPRSGTTLVHRLISMDDEVFTTIKLYQTIFPSVTATRTFKRLVEVAQTSVGGVLNRVYEFFNNPLESRWTEVHHLSLDQPEEDVCTLLWSLQSPALGLLFPFMDDLQSQTWLDRQSPEQRAAFMDCYESTLKRHVYEAGGKRFLNKNVFFAPSVRSMYGRFPDAAFVYLIRNPIDGLPSFLNMFYQAWKAHSPSIRPDGEEIQALKQLGYDYYRYALECRREIPKNQFIVIRYEDLVRDPKSTILGLYGRLDMPVSEAFEAKLDEAIKVHRDWESSRDFGLDFFGVTPEEVYSELRDVFEEFGYEHPGQLQLEAAE
ncbi:MAG: sulfotransferase [Myxococcales bacterium]|nr:sulfotransferase [Myxococcales bacterium]MDH3484238.1 sulfotransferase [Myxococcales bacterium]